MTEQPIICTSHCHGFTFS